MFVTFLMDIDFILSEDGFYKMFVTFLMEIDLVDEMDCIDIFENVNFYFGIDLVDEIDDY
jgi:hypothetical protein